MIRLNQTRRGISTVVTAAIMLTAVVVLGTSLVAFSNSKLTTFENGLAGSASDKTNKIKENLLIENVWFCSLCGGPPFNQGINITLTNAGNVGFNVTQIKINNQNFVCTTINPSTSILPGKSSSCKGSLTWAHNVPVNIVVTTARGLIYTAQVAPP